MRLGEGDVDKPDCPSRFIAIEVWIVVVEIGEDCSDDKGNAFTVGAGAGFKVDAKGLVWVELAYLVYGTFEVSYRQLSCSNSHTLEPLA